MSVEPFVFLGCVDLRELLPYEARDVRELLDQLGRVPVESLFCHTAAALLHLERGNRHGVAAVGGAALEKLAGPLRPDVEFEIEGFRAQLARALAGEGDPPRLEFRKDARERH